MTASLADFVSGSIYLDTMIPYTLLRADSHARAVLRPFFTYIEQGAITAFTSSLMFDELAYRLLLALIKDKYNGSPLDHLRQNETELMAEFYPTLVPELQRIRQFPNLHIIDVTATDIDLMLQFLLDYNLKPRDAIHLAAIETSGCHNIASNDHHFDAIPDITRYAIPLP